MKKKYHKPNLIKKGTLNKITKHPHGHCHHGNDICFPDGRWG